MTYLLHQVLGKSKDPNKVAVRDNSRQITYQQLEQRSDQLAYALLHLGVQRGDRVGIYVDKSLEAVVAIFGILKSGAAYVPLDINSPTQRIATIANNAEIKIFISTQSNIEALGSALLDDIASIITLVLVDSEDPLRCDHLSSKKVLLWSEVLKQVPVPFPVMVEDDLAYILYTSGSTGVPKGVMISHRAALTFVNWASETFAVNSADIVSSHAPFHFDLSIFDIFATIKAGATMVLVSREASFFPICLAKLIADEKITIWYSTPSILIKLVGYGRLNQFDLSSLRQVLFAGEVFPIKYLQQLIQYIPQADYYNLYGPTETNVCTHYKVPKFDLAHLKSLPIGKACDNSEIIVLDKDSHPVQPGEEGELCVRGPSLMLGYCGLPEKTAQTKVSMTIHSILGPEFVYRTGDFVKENSDGNYLYVGRRDNMVKSRGYRIELSEIEVVLYRHPNVESAAIIAVPDDEHGSILKAFIVMRDQTVDLSQAEREFKSFCSNHLPRYMIPHTFKFKTLLPLTSTGKTDINQLKQEA